VGSKPKRDPEELQELKAQLADHEERIAAIEAACRAFAVVFAIPRITDRTGGER
jgi:hypothetical protein